MRSCRGLEVVLPHRVSKAELSVILERHSDWILERHALLAARGEVPGQTFLPEAVRLEFSGREYRVVHAHSEKFGFKEAGDTVRLFYPNGQNHLAATLLQRWLIFRGKNDLAPRCSELAAEYRIPISGVCVRNQSSRWGSCSAKFLISLNAKLLFLGSHLVQHVILHELCHVEHRNHGPQFKERLCQLDPCTRDHEKLIRQAWEQLPAWSKRS